MNVVLDIWGGERSTEHVARFILSLDLAMKAAEQELRAGYLVNMRADHAWGPKQTFDHRQKGLLS